MRRQISVTNDIVSDALDKADNASKLIERAMLYYLDSLEKEYITRDEAEELVDNCNKKVCILNRNYTQMAEILNELAKEVFKQ